MTGAEDLVNKVRAYHSGADAALIRRAYEFSRQVHHGQKRQSGDRGWEPRSGGLVRAAWSRERPA